MKRSVPVFCLLFLVCNTNDSLAQSIDKIINADEVSKIEKILSADSMQGRKVFTPAIDKAADFIASAFKNNKLQYLEGLTSYRQEFTMVKPNLISATGTFDAQPVESKDIIAFTTGADLSIDNASGYEKIFLPADSNFIGKAFNYIGADKNYLLIVDTGNANDFNRLKTWKSATFKKDNSVILVLSPVDPKKYNLTIKSELVELKAANVVGCCRGKVKKMSMLFSRHIMII